MLLIAPPLFKPCEAPAGIARLAGSLRGAGRACTIIDANIEGILFLLQGQHSPQDTWSRRAVRHLDKNLADLRDPLLYTSFSRYQRAVADINRVLEQVGKAHGLFLQLANYHDPQLSPLKSGDLLQSAEFPERNIFYSYFADRLERLLEENPGMVGFSLNFLSQALTTFAMIGFVKKQYPAVPVVVGGGLITSWMQNPAWTNPFKGLIDHLVAGPGEASLLDLLGLSSRENSNNLPDYQDLVHQGYPAPGFILPYAASSGCYWSKCSFCPETAEGNPYSSLPAEQVVSDLADLCERNRPCLIHFLDNAISPKLMDGLIGQPPGVPWYGFARADNRLADPAFCRSLKRSGCVLLKLGLESGDQGVLDAMDKGIDLELVARVLGSLQQADIATYIYLLFGTPAESVSQARKTLSFIAARHEAVTFLNLAIFNLPVCSPETGQLAVRDFYTGDLSLYRDFAHPLGWNRKEVRQFLDREFKRHPAITPILHRDPPIFTSNHAPFFVGNQHAPAMG